MHHFISQRCDVNDDDDDYDEQCFLQHFISQRSLVNDKDDVANCLFHAISFLWKMGQRRQCNRKKTIGKVKIAHLAHFVITKLCQFMHHLVSER